MNHDSDCPYLETDDLDDCICGYEDDLDDDDPVEIETDDD